jgi:hypothetical protein
MLKLYGSNISYFTGKMENYFRVREIPYALHSMCFPQTEKQLKRELGLSQMPAVQLADGRIRVAPKGFYFSSTGAGTVQAGGPVNAGAISNH